MEIYKQTIDCKSKKNKAVHFLFFWKKMTLSVRQILLLSFPDIVLMCNSSNRKLRRWLTEFNGAMEQGLLLQLCFCMFSLCKWKPPQSLEHTELPWISRGTQVYLQDRLPHPHQGTQWGTLVKPAFSDVIIGEPWEPTRCIYLDHMDLPIVRLTANMAAGLSSANWARSSLTVLDGARFHYFPVFQTSGWFCVIVRNPKEKKIISK